MSSSFAFIAAMSYIVVLFVLVLGCVVVVSFGGLVDVSDVKFS